MTIEGIDISSKVTDPVAVAAKAAFVYMKATDGVGSPSGVIVQNANGLRIAGLGDMLGAYHFLRIRHGRAQDADEQCKEFLELRATAGCPLIAWLDIELGEEGSSNRAATKDEVKAATVMFLETWNVQTTDSLAWYSSPGESNMMGLVAIPELVDIPLALADYRDAPHEPPQFKPEMMIFWQRRGTTPFAGIAGGADLTRFFGTVEQLQAR
jgi:GH25 family lysozyme M1 (1,4-beta-N-acetylmuramidase)